MEQDRRPYSTNAAADGNAAALDGLEAVLANHATDLHPLAATLVRGALVARATVPSITRQMAGVAR